MGNVVSYFLAKPGAAALESGNAEDKGKKIEEAAINLEQEITEETSAVTFAFDDVKIEDAKEEKETVTNINEDDFEIIEEGKTLNVNDICYEAEDVAENISKELEQETSCDVIENEENVDIIKPIQENISESNEEDVLCPQAREKEDTLESINKTTESVEIIAAVPEVEIIDPVPVLESIADTENVEGNGCIKDIEKEPAMLEIKTMTETGCIEDIEEIESIQDDQEATETQEIELLQTEEPSGKNSLEQDSPEIIKTFQNRISEIPDMDTEPMSQTVSKEEGCMDTANVTDIELIGSIENDHQDSAEETLKQEDGKQSKEEPPKERTKESKSLEEKAYEPEIEDSFSKIINDCKMQVENIQKKMVGLGKDLSEDDMTTDDVCSCPHPELSKLENDICQCPQTEVANENDNDDVCHCPHPEPSNDLDENCCGLVENVITKATTTFLVDESGKTVNQLVYDLSEEHYGFEVMKESSIKFPEKSPRNRSECDSETAEGEALDKNLDLSSKDVDPETICDTEESIVQVDVEVISKTEREVDQDPSEDVLEVELIGSIQDCESGIDEAKTLEPKTEPLSLSPEPIKDTSSEPNRTKNQDNEDDEACSVLFSAKENFIGDAHSDGEYIAH